MVTDTLSKVAISDEWETIDWNGLKKGDMVTVLQIDREGYWRYIDNGIVTYLCPAYAEVNGYIVVDRCENSKAYCGLYHDKTWYPAPPTKAKLDKMMRKGYVGELMGARHG